MAFLTILLITQTKLLWAVSGDSQERSNVCLKRLQKKGREGSLKILLSTASLAIRNPAQFVFIRANRGKQPRRIANTHAYTAGSSLWACKHTSVIQQDGVKQACKHGYTQQTKV